MKGIPGMPGTSPEPHSGDPLATPLGPLGTSLGPGDVPEAPVDAPRTPRDLQGPLMAHKINNIFTKCQAPEALDCCVRTCLLGPSA